MPTAQTSVSVAILSPFGPAARETAWLGAHRQEGGPPGWASVQFLYSTDLIVTCEHKAESPVYSSSSPLRGDVMDQ